MKNITIDWRKYDHCEECGAAARAACHTEDDDVAEDPCPGRPLWVSKLEKRRAAKASSPEDRKRIRQSTRDAATKARLAAVPMPLEPTRSAVRRGHADMPTVKALLADWPDTRPPGLVAFNDGAALDRIAEVLRRHPDGMRAIETALGDIVAIIKATGRST